MKVLLLGSGGRESALAWGFARSPSVTDLVAAPGNPGIGALGDLEPVDLGDPAAVTTLATRTGPDLVVVGPELPLVEGVADALRERGVAVFGPDAAAARIEGSKSWAKELMVEAGVPSGRSRTFTEPDPALAFLDELGPPYVVKADGLAAGKGVVVTEDRREAAQAVFDRLIEGTFGEAGRRVVVEEFLDGPEASVIAFTDGRTVVACEPAQDFKRLLDGDLGPNTGGMGSYSPVPDCPGSMTESIVSTIIEPVVRVLRVRGTPFTGALYAGLALTRSGPKVIEFNARFGDPETQALIPRLRSDLGELCLAAARGELEGMRAEWSTRASVAVVLASNGYPGSFATGDEIEGLEDAAALPDVLVFHAGTALRDGKVVTAGGRVLAVAALGDDLARARHSTYAATSLIRFEGKQVRSDIAERAILAASVGVSSRGEKA